MTIEERMRRNSVEDKIYIGELIAQHLRGEFGQVVKYVAEGIKDRKLEESEQNPNIPPNRVLGVIVGITAVQVELNACVDIARSLKEEKRVESEVV